MCEPDAWGVSVANDVANEIGMRRAEEEVPDVSVDGFKDVGVGTFASCLNGTSSQLRWDVEFFGTARSEERHNHRVNLSLVML